MPSAALVMTWEGRVLEFNTCLYIIRASAYEPPKQNTVTITSSSERSGLQSTKYNTNLPAQFLSSHPLKLACEHARLGSVGLCCAIVWLSMQLQGHD